MGWHSLTQGFAIGLKYTGPSEIIVDFTLMKYDLDFMGQAGQAYQESNAFIRKAEGGTQYALRMNSK